MTVIDSDFYSRDCLEAAPRLVGKILARAYGGEILRLRITEAEAYRGAADTACHASRGMTARNRVLWAAPGTVYVYLCYGIHWMLNAITGAEGEPQGVLIRACEGQPGPGRLTKYLHIDGSLNEKRFSPADGIWLEDDGLRPEIGAERRVGIGYASPEDQARLWRFVMK